MSRYGWGMSREHSSPYSSMSGGVPNVTDDDFSYITSQDLDDPSLGLSDARRHPSSPSPDDDIILIKNKGVTYPTHFPAYAIGDGKLRVRDVRERVGLTMDISEKESKRIKLLYKGKQLKESSAPVRDYGVKNKSELLAILPEGGSISSDEEEMVIVGEPSRDSGKSRRRKRKGKKSSDKGDGESTGSARDSNKSPSPGSNGMKKLDELSGYFTSKWLPLCRQYAASPPSDPKKREDEHRKLSESILQQILLKLDEVDTEGVAEVRAKRKELVRQVQESLKDIDIVKKS